MSLNYVLGGVISVAHYITIYKHFCLFDVYSLLPKYPFSERIDPKFALWSLIIYRKVVDGNFTYSITKHLHTHTCTHAYMHTCRKGYTLGTRQIFSSPFGLCLTLSSAYSVLTSFDWILQIKWIWMKSWINSKTVQIRLFTLEWRPFIARNAYFRPCLQHNSFSFDQIFLNLTYKISLKLGGQLLNEVIQHILLWG